MCSKSMDGERRLDAQRRRFHSNRRRLRGNDTEIGHVFFLTRDAAVICAVYTIQLQS